MRITIMGSGGVGGYFGARLAQGGCNVSFVARSDHLAALREHGLRHAPLGGAISFFRIFIISAYSQEYLKLKQAKSSGWVIRLTINLKQQSSTAKGSEWWMIIN